MDALIGLSCTESRGMESYMVGTCFGLVVSRSVCGCKGSHVVCSMGTCSVGATLVMSEHYYY